MPLDKKTLRSIIKISEPAYKTLSEEVAKSKQELGELFKQRINKNSDN